jgi:hypothetical protein
MCATRPRPRSTRSGRGSGVTAETFVAAGSRGLQATTACHSRKQSVVALDLCGSRCLPLPRTNEGRGAPAAAKVDAPTPSHGFDLCHGDPVLLGEWIDGPQFAAPPIGSWCYIHTMALDFRAGRAKTIGTGPPGDTRSRGPRRRVATRPVLLDGSLLREPVDHRSLRVTEVRSDRRCACANGRDSQAHYDRCDTGRLDGHAHGPSQQSVAQASTLMQSHLIVTELERNHRLPPAFDGVADCAT